MTALWGSRVVLKLPLISKSGNTKSRITMEYLGLKKGYTHFLLFLLVYYCHVINQFKLFIYNLYSFWSASECQIILITILSYSFVSDTKSLQTILTEAQQSMRHCTLSQTATRVQICGDYSTCSQIPHSSLVIFNYEPWEELKVYLLIGDLLLLCLEGGGGGGKRLGGLLRRGGDLRRGLGRLRGE